MSKIKCSLHSVLRKSRGCAGYLALAVLLQACGGSTAEEPRLAPELEVDLVSQPVNSIAEISGIWSFSAYFADDGSLVDTSTNSTLQRETRIDQSGQVSEYYYFGSRENRCYQPYENIGRIVPGDSSTFTYIEGSIEEPLEVSFVGDKLIFAYGNRTISFAANDLTDDDLNRLCLGSADPEGFSAVEGLSDVVGVWAQTFDPDGDSFVLIDDAGNITPLRYDPSPEFDPNPCYQADGGLAGRLVSLSGNLFNLVDQNSVERYQIWRDDSDGSLSVSTLNTIFLLLPSGRGLEEFSERCTSDVDQLRLTGTAVKSLDEILGVWLVVEGLNNEAGEEVFYAYDESGRFSEIDFQGDGPNPGEACYSIANNYRLEFVSEGIFTQIFNGGATDVLEMYFRDEFLFIARPSFREFQIETLSRSNALLTDFTPTCPS